MKAFIQTDKLGEFYNVNAFVAYIGFKHLGFEIEKFHQVEDISDLDPESIVVGGVGTVRKQLIKLGIDLPKEELEYPEELTGYFGRKIWSTTLNHLRNHEVAWNIFVKPKQTKAFPGKVLRSFNDLITLNIHDDLDVWCSDVLDIVTEWRCFIRYDELLDVRYYKGAWDSKLDLTIVKKAISEFTNAPAAYCLDFGITKNGKLIIIEANDGHSLGSYGMGAVSYAKFLSARWAQLTKSKDFLHF